MIAAFSITPSGTGESVSESVAECVSDRAGERAAERDERHVHQRRGRLGRGHGRSSSSASTTSPRPRPRVSVVIKIDHRPGTAGSCDPRSRRSSDGWGRADGGQDEASRIGRVVSVNVGQPRQVRWHDRNVTTAIWKQPVAGRDPVAGVNLDGDDQADRRVHGGPTKSIYAYAAEDYGGGPAARLAARAGHLRREPDHRRCRPRRRRRR